MRHGPPRILLATVLCALAPFAAAQDKKESFPAKGWKTIKLKDKQRKKLSWSVMRELTPKKLYKLTVDRPADYDETVITTTSGTLLGRSDEDNAEFRFDDREIGERYVIWFNQKKQRRTLRFLEEFVEYPNREFPGRGWMPTKDSELKIKKPKQFTPKTMFEAFDKPHSITFKPPKTEAVCVYLMAKLEAGGKERVAAQTMGDKLEFWAHAKRGESFRIYQIFPHNKTYRATKTMTVEKDYPLGK